MPEQPPEIEESPSYHDLYITTSRIPRTSIFDLPYGLEVTCTRVGGWQVWDMDKSQPPRVRPRSGSVPAVVAAVGAGSRGVLIGGEYDDKWLVLDVAGHVIVDSRNKPHDESKDEASVGPAT